MKRISFLSAALLCAGIAFSQWNALPQFSSAHLVQVSFCDENYGWVLGHHFTDTSFFIFRTKDGGYTWDSTHFNSVVEKIFLLDQYHGFALLGSSVNVTSDGGTHWYLRPIPGEARDFFFTSPDTGWVATDFGLFKTSDAGNHWIPLSGFTGNPLKLWFTDSRNGYVVSYWPAGYVIGRTTDGGTTWGYNNFPEVSWFRMFGSGVGYLLNYHEHPILGVESYLMKTLDNGYSWDTLSLPGDNVFDASDILNCFFLNENTGWITMLPGNTMVQGIYRTDDGGSNWAFQSMAVPRAISFVSRDFGWCVGFPSHTVMHTFNGGGGSIGITENPEDPLGVKVWPNPCYDQLNIAFERTVVAPITIRILDASGREVKVSPVTNMPGPDQVNIALPGIPPGAYLLELSGPSGLVRCKVLKM